MQIKRQDQLFDILIFNSVISHKKHVSWQINTSILEGIICDALRGSLPTKSNTPPWVFFKFFKF